MAYNILHATLERNDARRRILNAVNAEVGDEIAESISDIIAKFGRRIFPVRWAISVQGAVVTSTGVTANPTLGPEETKGAIISALRKAKADASPGPKPPAPKPTDDEVNVVVHTDPVVWFRGEDDNLFHAESHTGIDPAEFYAVRQDAVNAGLTADGVCGA